MEVILRDFVENLGRPGDVVKVADGFARNYLLPRKLALAATPGNLKQVARERTKIDVREADEKAKADALAVRLTGIECVIARKSGENELLYGSVTSADVAESLAAQGLEVDKRKIQLEEPLKRLGEFTVPIKLHREVTASVTVRVVAQTES
jgi:large subunit ribosomal protein L9